MAVLQVLKFEVKGFLLKCCIRGAFLFSLTIQPGFIRFFRAPEHPITFDVRACVKKITSTTYANKLVRDVQQRPFYCVCRCPSAKQTLLVRK